MSRPFVLTHLTRDPAWIEAASAAGVERIGIDIERIGKYERQASNPAARISDHELEDLCIVSARCRNARPFARLNRPHSGSVAEIEQALACGARSLMLPGFSTAEEVREFVTNVSGRAEVILLVETIAAVRVLDSIIAVPGIDEVMVGLNDMSIELGMSGPTEVAASAFLENVAQVVHGAGVPFGCGGVARPDRADLPIPPDLLLARYIQLGAQSAWIARSFYNDGLQPEGLGDALAAFRERIDYWRSRSDAELDAACEQLRGHIHHHASS